MNLLAYLRRHKENDDRPYAIGGAAGMLLVVILSFFALAVADKYLLQSGGLAAVVSATLVDLANGDRASAAIAPLETNATLTKIAQDKANDMAAKGYFAHTSPDGKTPWYWYQQEGYSFLYAGENLAVDFNDSVDVNTAWMNSPEHRSNLLNGHFKQIGIATAQGTYKGHPTTFVVQEFGTPSSAPSAPVQAVTEPTTPTEPALATTEPSTTPAQAAGIATTAAPIALAAPTSTNATTAPVLGASAVRPAPSGALLARIVTSPLTVLHYAYYLIGFVILGLLAYVTRFELKRHHMHHVYAAGSLLILMAVLLALANFVIFVQPALAFGGS